MSLTMIGQPQEASLDFDVAGFEIVLEDMPPETGGVVEILDTNEPFTLKLEVKGTGTQWTNLCNNQMLKYTVHFDAEGIGPLPHNEYHLGEKTDSLQANTYAYTVYHTVANGIPNAGVYRLSAMVTFKEKAQGKPWKGLLGFAEGLVIQVHPDEE